MTVPRRRKDRHLPACMYHKHGAYWLVKANRWTRLGETLQEALLAYARLTTTHSAGSMPELIERVLEHIKPRLRPATLAQYTLAARRLADILAEFRPDQVRQKDVAAIKVHYAATPNMANRLISFLRVVFAHAVEWQIVDANPCIGVRRHIEARRSRYLTDDEYRAIHAAASPSLRAIMDIAYLTGQRIGDVLAIRIADIGPDGIAFRQGKTGQRVLVRMTPDLKAAIDHALALPRPVRGLTLFCTRRGGRPYAYGTVRDMWNAACKAAGVQDAHLHDLRAKSLTDAKRQGLDPQALGGHSSPTMTARYIRQRDTVVATPPSIRQPDDLLDKAS